MADTTLVTVLVCVVDVTTFAVGELVVVVDNTVGLDGDVRKMSFWAPMINPDEKIQELWEK